MNSRTEETRKQMARPRHWNVPVSKWVFGSMDAVALIASKTFQPWSAASVLAAAVERFSFRRYLK